MNLRHFTRRGPRWNIGFGRVPSCDGQQLVYRVFRRDHTGRTQMEERVFYRGTPRRLIAASVWHARIELRERVDHLWFVAQGLIPEGIAA